MTNLAQRSFASGELAPTFYARADLALYGRGLSTALNYYIMRAGGAQSRPGTTYKGTTKASGFARLVPCVFDEDQNYLLEFGDEYVRFWRDGSPISGTVIGAWANATVYAAGIVVSHSGTNYVSLQAHTSATANDRPNDGTNRLDYWHALTGTTYELPLPYTTQTEVREMQHAASVGVLRMAHRTYARRKLTRVSDAQWSLAEIASAPTIDFPLNLISDATPGAVVSWVVTAYDSVNGLESLASAPVSGDTEPASPADIFTQSWDAVAGATSYRVYKSLNGSVYGYVTEQTALSWIDTGALTINTSRTPPEQVADLSSAGDYPGVLGSYQQRILVSGSTNEPDTVRASKAGSPDDFTVSTPLQDDDAVSWRMTGERLVRPRHFLEVARRLVQFSSTGEEAIGGDESGILSPGAVNPQRISANGSATYPSPLPVNDSALYVQARGGVVRDLLAGEAGSDLTVTAQHLVDGYTILEWCYQQTPHSIVWAVRDDGVLLSLTYQRETGVLAWARHVTDGAVESVACVPEGDEDAVYLVVNRTINGSTVRYIERLALRSAAIAALVACDASATISGVHPHDTLSLDFTGSTYTIPTNTTSNVVATGSGGSGSFTSADVGRTFAFIRSAVTYAATITGYTSPTVVTLEFVGDATGWTNPTAVTTANWYWTSVSGLSHLALEPVSVVLDGMVYASPNNPAYTARTVTSGGIVLLANTAAFTTAIVGLPFTTDLGTLDIDRPGTSLKEGTFLVQKVGLWLEDSRGFWAGPQEPTTATGFTLPGGGALQRCEPVDEDQNTTADLVTGYRATMIDGHFSNSGRIFIRNVDPTPLTVLALVPSGIFPR